MTQCYAEITGWGKCLPPATLSNHDLSTFLDTSDEWIQSRTGIEQRRISHVNTSDLATVAAQHAIACAGVSVEEIDLDYCGNLFTGFVNSQYCFKSAAKFRHSFCYRL